MDDRRTAFAELEAATARMVATVSALTDADLRAPSLLPGWTRAHVVTHLARNADSYRNLLRWARTGVETPQYQSVEQREADLEAGVVRSPADLLEDVRATAEGFADDVRALPDDAWGATVRSFHGWEHPAWHTVHRRWREVEAHHADLDAGYSHEDWPERFVRWELAHTLTGLREHGGLAASRVRATDLDLDVRLGGEGPEIEGPARELIAWLAGRTDGGGLSGGPLPDPPAWPQAFVKDWRST
jgi:uncharacterized protein (TIGR03083 family)